MTCADLEAPSTDRETHFLQAVQAGIIDGRNQPTMDILRFPTRLSCLAESEQRHDSQNPILAKGKELA